MGGIFLDKTSRRTSFCSRPLDDILFEEHWKVEGLLSVAGLRIAFFLRNLGRSFLFRKPIYIYIYMYKTSGRSSSSIGPHKGLISVNDAKNILYRVESPIFIKEPKKDP